MAVLSAFSVRAALPTRHAPAASAWPTPPRVYSPLYPRRLAHPMAVPATQGLDGSASSDAATVAATRRGSPLSLLKR
jgi:hypothetical protein